MSKVLVLYYDAKLYARAAAGDPAEVARAVDGAAKVPLLSRNRH